MDVSIQHLVGTITLIGLVITTGLSYTIITSYIETDVTKQQLKQIAEYVSLNLVEIVNLVNFADFLNNSTMMKVLDIPSDLGGRAYVVKLVDETSQGQGYYVYANLATRKDLAAISPITLNSTENRLVLMTESEGTLLVGREETKIQYSGTVYGGIQSIVVWGWRKDDGTTWAGIGVWKSQG